MARVQQISIPAKYKYNTVHYSHIQIRPGENAVLTADPWSYLHGFLLQACQKKRGDNKKNLERAIYFAGLAESFYKAGELVELPAKGTLLYYGMLNLVKCLLSVKGVVLESVMETHGLSLSPENKFELKVASTQKNAVNIFSEFVKVLGTPVVGAHSLKLVDVISHIPELHGIAVNLNFVKKPKFLPIDIRFLTNESHSQLFTEVSYDKRHEHAIQTEKFLTGERRTYYLDGNNLDNRVVHRSKGKKKLANNNWIKIYQNILKEYSKMKFASMLTDSGYRYYSDLESGNYHHLACSFMVMFYIGTASRYRPSEVNEVMSGRLRPLVSESVALCPRQFLYQLVGITTNRQCIIPYAMV